MFHETDTDADRKTTEYQQVYLLHPNRILYVLIQLSRKIQDQ